MDKARKKELLEQYKNTKPGMGIFIIRSKINNKYHVQGTQDLHGVMNGTLVKLAAGIHPNHELQKEWTEFGESNFTVEILEKLEYDKDESKNDYTEELSILQMIWEEKLTKEKLEAYKKRIK